MREKDMLRWWIICIAVAIVGIAVILVVVVIVVVVVVVVIVAIVIVIAVNVVVIDEMGIKKIPAELKTWSEFDQGPTFFSLTNKFLVRWL